MQSLVDVFQPVGILATIWIGFYFAVKAITDYILRKKMIEKGYVDKESQALFTKENMVSNNMSSLKWGLIVFFGGLALILLEFIPYHVEDSPLPYGLIAIFVAGGFLSYYFFAKNKMEN